MTTFSTTYAQPAQTFAAKMSPENFDAIKKQLNQKPILVQSYSAGQPFKITGDMLEIGNCRQTEIHGKKRQNKWLLKLKALFTDMLDGPILSWKMAKSDDLTVVVQRVSGVLDGNSLTPEQIQRISEKNETKNRGYLDKQIAQLGKNSPLIAVRRDVIMEDGSMYRIMVNPNKYNPEQD